MKTDRNQQHRLAPPVRPGRGGAARPIRFAAALAWCLVMQAAPASLAQLTIVATVPGSTPAGAEVHVAGNFNGWDPGSPAYRLTADSTGYTITIDPEPGSLEFKFTRGSWEAVEGNAGGGVRPNRTLSYGGDSTRLDVSILSWEDLDGGSGGGGSTAAENVSVLSDAFYMPQLDRSRRVWIYLPPDYETSSKRYPVLYLQDGQNAFDTATSFAGEWEVDETLNDLFESGDKGCIVVAVENGGALRSSEYHPWLSPGFEGFGGGEGDEYADFVALTLKPYVDTNYRTLSDRLNTGVAGSSSGGVISFYIAMKYSDVFGRAGLFSPAFFVNPELFDYARATAPVRPDPRYYFVSGLHENVAGFDFAPSQRQMVDTLLAAGYIAEAEVTSTLPADGTHAEWFWAREFSAVYRWLFGPSTSTAIEPGQPHRAPARLELRAFPNPVPLRSGYLSIDLSVPWESGDRPMYSVQVFDSTGRVVMTTRIREGTTRIFVGHLASGVYVLRAPGGVTQRFVKL